MDNFTCTSCNGTGFWTPCGSQNYRGDRHCYTCNGKGRFKTSSEDRAKARTQRLARKDAKRVANLESGESQLTQALGEHGLAWLEAATWSPFFQDLLSRARRFGSLSDAQLACLVKGYEKSKVRDAERAAEQAAEAARVEAAEPVLNGRQLVTGHVITTKWVDSQYGGSLKMLVRDDRGFKLWGSVPASLGRQTEYTHNALGERSLAKGDRISFTATLEQSNDDPKFGFFKRPTMAALLSLAHDSEDLAVASVA